jgi:putative membrane protein
MNALRFHSPLLVAHGAPAVDPGPSDWSELARAWEFEPLVVLALVASAAVYRRGSRRLRAAVGANRGLPGWQTACYWTGWWTLVIALASPLHAWGQVLFSAHMTQHELLMLAAAPLLVLGRPMVAFLFALPRGDARYLSRMVRSPGFRRAWEFVTRPLVAWGLHAAALWLWHVPVLFEATLRLDFVHHLQHASFFGSALLFWWALFHARAGLQGIGAALLYLFTTMLHSGLLGAGLTFAQTLIYPTYGTSATAWALTPLEDQQLGGLIMWIPAGLVYVIASLILLAGWLGRPGVVPTIRAFPTAEVDEAAAG